MKKIVEIIFDRDSFFEIKPRFGRPAIVGLARLDGQSVGIIANNPAVGGGALSADACRKSSISRCCATASTFRSFASWTRRASSSGSTPSAAARPGHIMNFMNATCLTTVPQITVIARKAYGRAYVAMGGGAHNDTMVAWPTAEVSFMDPVFATNIVHNLSAGDEGFEDALAHIQKDLEIWDMARIFSAHDVIKPQETRDFLIRMFDVHRRRRSSGARPASDADLADQLLSPRMYRDIIARARSKGRAALDEAAGKTLLAAFGIRVPKSVVVAGSDNAATALRGLTPPFAVKVVSREILHKSDAGGVTLNVADARSGRAGDRYHGAKNPVSPANPSRAGWSRR